MYIFGRTQGFEMWFRSQVRFRGRYEKITLIRKSRSISQLNRGSANSKTFPIRPHFVTDTPHFRIHSRTRKEMLHKRGEITQKVGDKSAWFSECSIKGRCDGTVCF